MSRLKESKDFQNLSSPTTKNPGAQTEVDRRTHKEVIYLGDEAPPMEIVAMPGGMASGQTSISMRLPPVKREFP